jgi:hypothetical protein
MATHPSYSIIITEKKITLLFIDKIIDNFIDKNIDKNIDKIIDKIIEKTNTYSK